MSGEWILSINRHSLREYVCYLGMICRLNICNKFVINPIGVSCCFGWISKETPMGLISGEWILSINRNSLREYMRYLGYDMQIVILAYGHGTQQWTLPFCSGSFITATCYCLLLLPTADCFWIARLPVSAGPSHGAFETSFFPAVFSGNPFLLKNVKVQFR